MQRRYRVDWLRKRAPLALAAVILGGGCAAVAAGAFLSAPARSSTCDSGASSVSATFASGRWEVSQPVTTGCVVEDPANGSLHGRP